MRERKRRTYNQNFNSGLRIGKYSSLVLGFLLVASLFVFTGLINSQAISKQDEINKLSVKRAELEKEKERLMFEANRLQSIQEIQKSGNQKTSAKLVPVKNINYLPSSNVALK